MAGSVTDWVASKIEPNDGIAVVGRTPEDFLIIQNDKGMQFPVAIIGVSDLILPKHVSTVLSQSTKPQFVMNVPSKTLWSGPAIDAVHKSPAAFGTLGDLRKASRQDEVWRFRNKELDFFEQAIGQHSNVYEVKRLFDRAFEAHRKKGQSLKIALIEAYNMSAEDVRNARDRYGPFDVAVKMSSYGSITSAADNAAASIGAEAVMFKGLMQRLAR